MTQQSWRREAPEGPQIVEFSADAAGVVMVHVDAMAELLTAAGFERVPED